MREIKDKDAWEGLFEKQKEKTFLQSWAWGEFQQRVGNKIWRLGLYDNDELLSVVLAVKVKAKRGSFLLIQHGVLISEELVNKLKETAKEENCSFIRITPLLLNNEENRKLFQKFGFREASMHANAYEATLKLDIAKSEEELLANMRKTTRYLIRQTLKNEDISIEKSDRAQNIKPYQQLNKEVAGKQGFIPFSGEFIENEFEVFSKDNQALWIFGKYKEETTAAALIIFWSGIGFYHQAASSEKYQKLSIPYLIQWEAIREAKKRGCSLYDFWGFVDPKKHPKHPWAGPTLFKLGFGGQPIEYLKTQDLPLSKKYWLTYSFERLRKIKRGL